MSLHFYGEGTLLRFLVVYLQHSPSMTTSEVLVSSYKHTDTRNTKVTVYTFTFNYTTFPEIKKYSRYIIHLYALILLHTYKFDVYENVYFMLQDKIINVPRLKCYCLDEMFSHGQSYKSCVCVSMYVSMYELTTATLRVIKGE